MNKNPASEIFVEEMDNNKIFMPKHEEDPGSKKKKKNSPLEIMMQFTQSDNITEMRRAGARQLPGNPTNHASHGKAVRMDQIGRDACDKFDQVRIDVLNRSLLSLCVP